MTELPPSGEELPPHTNGKTESPPLGVCNEAERNFKGSGGLDSDSEGELNTSATFSKAISGQASHYMLTFENGLQDDSDSEVEELTKSLPSLSDRNNNGGHLQRKPKEPREAAGSGEVRSGADQPAPPSHPHFMCVVKGSDSELSDDGVQDRPLQPGDLQIPLGDSDTDDEHDTQADPTGGFLHVADDGNSSVRPDTPTPRGYNRTRITVDSTPDSGSESGFIRPRPLSGSTTAVFGSMESLTQGTNEVQYRNKRFSASEVNLSASGPVEGLFGNVPRWRAFHGSMQRLSTGSLPVPAVHPATLDNESRNAGGAGLVPAQRGLSRRWSLANADANALDEVR